MKRNQDESINKKHVGRRISIIRKRKLLTLIEFAEKVGASKSSVSDWEKGFRLPPESVLFKIAIMGNTTVDKLLYGNGKNDIEELYKSLIKLPKGELVDLIIRMKEEKKNVSKY
nr:MAG TPA: helix-turn-helix domain protein [Caudoviricetes sp.]